MSRNVCIRCGKQRIIAKTWKEKVMIYGKSSLVEYTEMVCPDKSCQEKVEKELKIRKEKTAQMEKDKQDRVAAHKTQMVNLRLSKTSK